MAGRLENVRTAKFSVWQDASVATTANTSSSGQAAAYQRCAALLTCPITDLTSFIPVGELKNLGEYLAEQDLFHVNHCTRTEFAAAGRKHANAIELQDRSDYGDTGATAAETAAAAVVVTKVLDIDFHECRARRGSAEFWRHNENATRLPGLVAFVDKCLPFFESTGKVTIILSNAGDVGVEHVDHKFKDLVSEFVWLQTGVGPSKQFFVRDTDGTKHHVKNHDSSNKKDTTDMNTKKEEVGACIWFDDHHSHNIDTIDEACYSIRVDGVFTDEFRTHICTVGTFADGSKQGAGLCAVLQAQRGVPLSESAALSRQTANAKAHDACRQQQDSKTRATMNADTVVVSALRDELAEAHRRIAKLEEALMEKEKQIMMAQVDDDPPPPPYLGPPRGLCDDSLFCSGWSESVRPLYELQMGTENMAPLLYSIIRFTKPEKVLEVGAGFTTIFALQALCDNDAEVDTYQRLYRQSQEGTFEWPKLNWVNENYMQQSGAGYKHGQLHCVDNMAHAGTTAHLVSTVAETLGLEDRLRLTEGDAMRRDTREELEEDLGGEGRVGLMWLDFGDGDRLDEVLLDLGYWDLVDPNGGLVLVHSALTNAASRQWLKRMKHLAVLSTSTTHDANADVDTLSDVNQYGPFEILSLLEPHKMRQNSVTVIRRKGPCAQEPFEEPIFTQYA